MPPKSIRPPGSEEAGEIALESAFVAAEEKTEVIFQLSGTEFLVLEVKYRTVSSLDKEKESFSSFIVTVHAQSSLVD